MQSKINSRAGEKGRNKDTVWMGKGGDGKTDYEQGAEDQNVKQCKYRTVDKKLANTSPRKLQVASTESPIPVRTGRELSCRVKVDMDCMYGCECLSVRG